MAEPRRQLVIGHRRLVQRRAVEATEPLEALPPTWIASGVQRHGTADTETSGKTQRRSIPASAHRRGVVMRSFRGVAWRGRLLLTLLVVGGLCSCASTSTPPVAGACATPSDAPIANFCVVTPHVLWRGARPDLDGATWLLQHGVRTVVNLELLHGDDAAFGQATAADATGHEVGYFHIQEWEPLPLLAPAVVDDHVAHFLALVSQQPKPIYVHCRSGLNRTGVMVAAYRVLMEGISAPDAIEEMGRYQGQWFNVDAHYIRGLGPERREEIRRKTKEWILKLKSTAHILCTNGTCVVNRDTD